MFTPPDVYKQSWLSEKIKEKNILTKTYIIYQQLENDATCCGH